MTFAIDDAFLPAILTGQPMSDEDFTAFCADYPDLFFEMTAEGDIVVMPPAFSITGAQNLEVAAQLGIWAKQNAVGLVCDSSTGFVLPNGVRGS